MISKIKTKEMQAKKDKRNQLILGAGLVLLLIASTAGFSLINADQANSNGALEGSLEEYGIKFTRQGNFWLANIQGQTFYFQHLPSELTEISAEGDYSISNYQGQILYFVNSQSSSGEILNNLHPLLQRYQTACLEGMECGDENLPIKTCDDKVIVSVEDSTETRIYKEDNCVYLLGDPIKAADTFIYKILGIL